MEELQPEELEELVQELQEESEQGEALSPEVEELLRDLEQATFWWTRKSAAERLGELSESSPRIVQSLITARESDSFYGVREAAVASLRAPVHQHILQQHPDLIQRARPANDQAATQREEQGEKQAERQRAVDARDRCLEKAFALEDRDAYEEALEECDTAIQLDPTLADAHNLRGVILEELGRNGEAIQAYREALRLDFGFAAARENLQAAEAELDDYRIGSRVRRSRCSRKIDVLQRCPEQATFRCQECGDALCRTHTMLFRPPDAGSGQDEHGGVYCAFHYRTAVERASLQAVGADLEVLFEAKDQSSHYTWQVAGVDLDPEACELTIHGYPRGEPEITVPVSQIASCEIVEREDVKRNFYRALEGGGCGGSGDWADLLLIPLLLLAYAFLEIMDRALAKSTKVPVLKLAQSSSDGLSQGWVIHLRSKKRGRPGQDETLKIADRVAAFLRQAGYDGAIPQELSVPVGKPAVPSGGQSLPVDLEASADEVTESANLAAPLKRTWFVVNLAIVFAWALGVYAGSYLATGSFSWLPENLPNIVDAAARGYRYGFCCTLPVLAFGLFFLWVVGRRFIAGKLDRTGLVVAIVLGVIISSVPGCLSGLFAVVEWYH